MDEEDGPAPPVDAELSSVAALKEIGAILADLRRRQGTTAETLGSVVGMSQPKISKIERGVSRPKPEDVHRLATALNAPPEMVAELVEKARQLPPVVRRGQPRPPRAPTPAMREDSVEGVVGQHQYFDEEGMARHIQNLEATIVPGLLQTSEYTRQLVNSYHAFSEGGSSQPMWQRTAATVALRAQRQQRLYDTKKTFIFVIMESVILNRVGTPGNMLAQVDRIEAAAELPNVTILIVPTTAQINHPPLHGFTILDGATVLTEALDTVRHHDPSTLRFYQRSFEHYASLGDARLDLLLERYKRLYADQARPREEPESTRREPSQTGTSSDDAGGSP